MTDKEEREQVLKTLTNMRDWMEAAQQINSTPERINALNYAISSIKTDLKYDLLYEGKQIADADKMIPNNSEIPTGSTTKKDCNTCTYSNEIDGSNCYECVKDIRNNYESTTKNNLAVDCISRAYLLDDSKYHTVFNDDTGNFEDVVYREDIEKAPSVTPEQKKGKWEFVGDNCFRCTKCGEVYTLDQLNHINNYCDGRFPKGCPNCASEMESEQ